MPDYRVRFIGDLGNLAAFSQSIRGAFTQIRSMARSSAASPVQSLRAPNLSIGNVTTQIDSYNRTITHSGQVFHQYVMGWTADIAKLEVASKKLGAGGTAFRTPTGWGSMGTSLVNGRAGVYAKDLKPQMETFFTGEYKSVAADMDKVQAAQAKMAQAEEKLAAIDKRLFLEQTQLSAARETALMRQMQVIKELVPMQEKYAKAVSKGSYIDPTTGQKITSGPGRLIPTTKELDQLLRYKSAAGVPLFKNADDLETALAINATRRAGSLEREKISGRYMRGPLLGEMYTGEERVQTALRDMRGIADLESEINPRIQEAQNIQQNIENLDKKEVKLLRADARRRKAWEREAASVNAELEQAWKSTPPIPVQLDTFLTRSKDFRKRFLQAYKMEAPYVPAAPAGASAADQARINAMRETFNRELISKGINPDSIRAVYDMERGVYRLTGTIKDANGIEGQWNETIDKNGRRIDTHSSTLGRHQGFLRQTARDFQKVVEWTIATTAVFGALGVAMGSLGKINQVNYDLARFSLTAKTTGEQTNQAFKDIANIAYKTATPLAELTAVMDDIALATRRATQTQDEWLAAINQLAEAVGILTNLTGVDTVRATDLLSAAYKQLGILPSQIIPVLNKVTAVAGGNAQAIEEIVQALGSVSQAAGAAGLNLDEQIAAVQVLSQVTNKTAADVATSFKNLFGSISSPGSVKILDEFGISVRTATGELRPFLEIYKDIYDARQAGVISEGRLQDVLRGISGGPRRAPDAAALLENMPLIYEQLDKTISASNEALMANARILETNTAKLQQMRTMFDTTLIESFTQSVNELINVFYNMGELMNKFLGGGGGTLLKFGMQLLIIATAAAVLGKSLSVLRNGISSLKGEFAALNRVSVMTGTWLDRFNPTVRAMKAAAAPAIPKSTLVSTKTPRPTILKGEQLPLLYPKPKPFSAPLPVPTRPTIPRLPAIPTPAVTPSTPTKPFSVPFPVPTRPTILRLPMNAAMAGLPQKPPWISSGSKFSQSLNVLAGESRFNRIFSWVIPGNLFATKMDAISKQARLSSLFSWLIPSKAFAFNIDTLAKESRLSRLFPWILPANTFAGTLDAATKQSRLSRLFPWIVPANAFSGTLDTVSKQSRLSSLFPWIAPSKAFGFKIDMVAKESRLARLFPWILPANTFSGTLDTVAKESRLAKLFPWVGPGRSFATTIDNLVKQMTLSNLFPWITRSKGMEPTKADKKVVVPPFVPVTRESLKEFFRRPPTPPPTPRLRVSTRTDGGLVLLPITRQSLKDLFKPQRIAPVTQPPLRVSTRTDGPTLIPITRQNLKDLLSPQRIAPVTKPPLRVSTSTAGASMWTPTMAGFRGFTREITPILPAIRGTGTELRTVRQSIGSLIKTLQTAAITIAMGIKAQGLDVKSGIMQRLRPDKQLDLGLYPSISKPGEFLKGINNKILTGLLGTTKGRVLLGAGAGIAAGGALGGLGAATNQLGTLTTVGQMAGMMMLFSGSGPLMALGAALTGVTMLLSKFNDEQERAKRNAESLKIAVYDNIKALAEERNTLDDAKTVQSAALKTIEELENKKKLDADETTRLQQAQESYTQASLDMITANNQISSTITTLTAQLKILKDNFSGLGDVVLKGNFSPEVLKMLETELAKKLLKEQGYYQENTLNFDRIYSQKPEEPLPVVGIEPLPQGMHRTERPPAPAQEVTDQLANKTPEESFDFIAKLVGVRKSTPFEGQLYNYRSTGFQLDAKLAALMRIQLDAFKNSEVFAENQEEWARVVEEFGRWVSQAADPRTQLEENLRANQANVTAQGYIGAISGEEKTGLEARAAVGVKFIDFFNSLDKEIEKLPKYTKGIGASLQKPPLSYQELTDFLFGPGGNGKGFLAGKESTYTGIGPPAPVQFDIDAESAREAYTYVQQMFPALQKIKEGTPEFDAAVYRFFDALGYKVDALKESAGEALGIYDDLKKAMDAATISAQTSYYDELQQLQARMQGGEFKGQMDIYRGQRSQLLELIDGANKFNEAFKQNVEYLGTFQQELSKIKGLEGIKLIDPEQLDQLIPFLLNAARTFGLTGKEIDTFVNKVIALIKAIAALDGLRANPLVMIRIGTVYDPKGTGGGAAAAASWNALIKGGLNNVMQNNLTKQISGLLKDIQSTLSGGGGTSTWGAGGGGGSSGGGGGYNKPGLLDIPDEFHESERSVSSLLNEAVKKARDLQSKIPGETKANRKEIVAILDGTKKLLQTRGIGEEYLRRAMEELAEQIKKQNELLSKADSIRRIRVGAGDFAAIANVPINATSGIGLTGDKQVNVTLNLNGTILTPAQFEQFANKIAAALKRQLSS